MVKKKIVVGQKYLVKKNYFNKGVEYKVVNVTGQSDDDYVTLKSTKIWKPSDFPNHKTPTKEARHFNNLRPRVWWLRGYTEEVKN